MSRCDCLVSLSPKGTALWREQCVPLCLAATLPTWRSRFGGARSWQRWLIPPQWLIEELQGEAIYNQTFQVQCSSIFSRKRTRMGMAHKTSRIKFNLHPNIVPRTTQPLAYFSQHLFQVFCSATWLLSSWCKILVITHQLLREQGDNCEYHQHEQNTNSFSCSFEADTC